VEAALPPTIGADNSALVSKMQAPALGTPIRRTFNVDTAVQQVFGTTPPTYDPACREGSAQATNPDQGECSAWSGEATGTGAYVRMSYSKNLAEGNVGFQSRGLVVKPTTATLRPVDMDNAKALELAMEFLNKSFGLPVTEIPLPPKDAPNANPFVSDQAIGFSAKLPPVIVAKIVTLPRGIKLKSPIVDEKNGRTLPYLPAPGNAMAVLDNEGVTGALIQDWQELRVNTALDPKRAKTRADLVNEIANGLMQEGGGTLGRISAHLVYGSDWRGSYGYLVPAVRILVAPVAGDQSAEQMKAHFDAMTPTAGFIHDYPLVPSVEPAPTTTAPTRTTP